MDVKENNFYRNTFSACSIFIDAMGDDSVVEPLQWVNNRILDIMLCTINTLGNNISFMILNLHYLFTDVRHKLDGNII